MGMELQLNKFVGCKREQMDVDLMHAPFFGLRAAVQRNGVLGDMRQDEVAVL
jgi:hypothetical protein